MSTEKPPPRSEALLFRCLWGMPILIWLLDCCVLAVGVAGWLYSHFVLDGELKAPTAFISILLLLFCVALPAWQHPVGRRVFAAGLFAFFSVSIMAISSAVAWYRNPKHAGHLPDVLHEAVPYVEEIHIPFTSYISADGKPWSVGGLELAEVMLSVVVFTTAGWALTQRWRWLVLRRACIVYGTLALLRTVTILVTAVPDASPRCSGSTPGTFVLSELPWRAAFARGLAIIVGHLSDPCRSAGDMVFSGHSMVLVLCGMVWHAYYRTKPGTFTINPVKTTVWVLVGCTLFLIVVTRLHYTLDVLLAVYFAITLFNAYHRLADDVLVGHRFMAVWIFDGLVIYPLVEWIEAPHLGEAQAAGMVSNIGLPARPASSPTAFRASASGALNGLDASGKAQPQQSPASRGGRGAGIDGRGAGAAAAAGGGGAPQQLQCRCSSQLVEISPLTVPGFDGSAEGSGMVLALAQSADLPSLAAKMAAPEGSDAAGDAAADGAARGGEGVRRRRQRADSVPAILTLQPLPFLNQAGFPAAAAAMPSAGSSSAAAGLPGAHICGVCGGARSSELAPAAWSAGAQSPLQLNQPFLLAIPRATFGAADYSSGHWQRLLAPMLGQLQDELDSQMGVRRVASGHAVIQDAAAASGDESR